MSQDPSTSNEDGLSDEEAMDICERLNIMLRSHLSKRHREYYDKHEPTVKEKLRPHIDSLRQEMGLKVIKPDSPEGSLRMAEQVVSQILGIDIDAVKIKTNDDHAMAYRKLVLDADQLLAEHELREIWSYYLISWLMYGEPPAYTAGADEAISVRGVARDGSLWLKLEKTLDQTDYVNSWDVLKDYLSDQSPLSGGTPYNQDRDVSIWQDKQSGMTNRQLAEKYFPAEEVDKAMIKIKRIARKFR